MLGERHLTLYRKPTFTGQYTRWDSFSCQRYKINLIKSLVHRAMRICTNEETLEEEIQQLRMILNNNGYPANVVEQVICVTREPANRLVGPKKTSSVLATALGRRQILKRKFDGQ